jgi:SAM-dependent methyltransferase
MRMQQAAIEHNQRAWDKMARNGQRFTTAARDDEFVDPLAKLDACGWLDGGVAGKRLLCLAAGGGRQAPLYAAAGAQVTVVDISSAQLELDRQVASERNLQLRTVQTSMDDLSMFAQAEFEIVIHPVSTCYVPDVRPVFDQIARVTCTGGLYISQHKQPTSLQTGTVPSDHGYQIIHSYYHQGALPDVHGSLHREHGTLEFIHRWEEIIGGMCRAGFVVEGLFEPFHANAAAKAGTFAHRSAYTAPYVRIKARRCERASSTAEKSESLWLPGPGSR